MRQERRVIVLEQCRRELRRFPVDLREDLADALARLAEGRSLSMPLSRSMKGLGTGVHEIRLHDASGIYRVIYALLRSGSIVVAHAFKKTTPATAKPNIDLARQRLRRFRR